MLLLEYSLTNFQSFLNEATVRLEMPSTSNFSNWTAEGLDEQRVSKLLAVVGHNASGKTALLKGLSFIAWFMSESFTQIAVGSGIPVTAHFTSEGQPTVFRLLFEHEGRVWRYELSCTPERVLHEALYVKRDRFGYVFIRDFDAKTNSYLTRKKDFDFSVSDIQRVRPNASVLSTAIQHESTLATSIVNSLPTQLVTNVNLAGLIPHYLVLDGALQNFDSNPDDRAAMNELLSRWDFGLHSIEVREIETPPESGSPQRLHLLEGHHRIKDRDYPLPFMFESSGTHTAFVMLSRILPVLRTGGVAVIDEFESNLHPNMLEAMLDLFGSPISNPLNAQLIFATHSAYVLNLLQKSQILLVEKNEDGESECFRLDEVEGVRTDENFSAKYLAGAYGGVPRL
jgi:energy-coupling factor transporter ATP-binding protein EcfA2